ncbi:MAG: Rieske (2Fe-2S) protein [Acidobacteriales bacterium]|nr:Rieske (2Fe-2S) protein [Terriglobales bacterium]
MEQNSNEGRRDFLKKACAICIGGATMIPPIGAGVAVLLDPVRKKAAARDFVPVGFLSALPEDGTPRKFTVVTTREDAWNKMSNVPVGAVYLRRTGPQTVQALNVVCPHAGCFVDFVQARNSYLCPCHDSTFAVDGKINDSKSPAARGMDELETSIRNGNEVWVKFQNFLAGEADKIPA